jgi:LCP family protein required for cell wall assembly
MLSIPRDLWVQIPGYGENRINTAHFFAEAQQPGSGPLAAKAVIQANFGVEMQYFIRFRFDSFVDFINAVGGVEITLAEPMSGLPAGVHRLDAAQTLAFVRDRQGADDFSRLRKAQIVLQAVIASALSPSSIPRWPGMAEAALNALETDVPLYLWPKLGVIYLLAGSDNLEARIIEREMVQPFVTNQGAQVLLPRWDLIQPLILEMFGQ